MIRETIHGLDNLIVTTIHHSVVIITGALCLGVALFPIIEAPWNQAFLFITTLVAFILTLGSHKRLKLYSGLLTEHVAVGQELEERLLSDDNVKITKRIEKEVKYAGRKGEIVFKRGIMAFYVIEVAIFVYLVYSILPPFSCWKI
jgi:hypothetical protein